MSSENGSPLFAQTNPLNTPEILRIIFEFCADDAGIALVCSLWRDASLPVFWRNVSFRKLLVLLPPLGITEIDGTRVEKFSRDVDPKDWDRFFKYAGVVRFMTVGSEARGNPYPAFLLDIACARPQTRRDMFPNLTSLDIGGDAVPYLQVLGNERLTSLTLRFPIAIDSLFSMILRKHPHLRTLTCSSHEDISLSAASELATLLRTLELRHVGVPPTWCTPAIVASLVHCAHLERLSLSLPSSKSNAEVETFPITFPLEAFPRLHTLNMIAPFDRACRAFSLPGRLPELAYLVFYSFTQQSTPSQLSEFTRHISDNHSNLRTLYIQSVNSVQGNALDWYSTIDNVRNMSSLSQLIIVHNATIHVNLHNLVTLSQALPRLDFLQLRISNNRATRPLLEVSALLGIIPLFPLLTRFEMFMDTSATTFPEVAPSMKFQRLTSLNLGLNKGTSQTFTIANPFGLAAFLDSILPDTCQLDPRSSRNRSWTSVCTSLQTLRAGRIPSQQ